MLARTKKGLEKNQNEVARTTKGLESAWREQQRDWKVRGATLKQPGIPD